MSLKVKKALVMFIVFAMCSSLFLSFSHPAPATAESSTNVSSASLLAKTAESEVKSVGLETKGVKELNEKDVTDYYRNNPDVVSKLLSNQKADVPTGGITWIKAYGGKDRDRASSIQQTSDGGYIVAGYTSLPDEGEDFLVIKLDANGNINWAKTYGGMRDETASSIQQTSDGGYIVAGYTWSFGAGHYDFLIIKLNANGNITWVKTYGGSKDDYAYSIQQTQEGGYIIAGSTKSFGKGYYSNCLIIKLDVNGNATWAKMYGGSKDDYAYSIQQTQEGGYIIAGSTKSFNTRGDTLTIRLDTNGNIIWAKINGYNTFPIQQTQDGGYIVVEWTWSFNAGGNSIIIKRDAKDNIMWAKIYKGEGSGFISSIRQTSDGGYIVAGYTDTESFSTKHYENYDDFLVIKLDANGNVIGQNCTYIVDVTADVDIKPKNIAATNVNLAITSSFPLVTSPYLAVTSQTIEPKIICRGNTVIYPSAPQDLTATATTSSITLNWTYSTQGTYPVAGYAIYRGTISEGESDTPIATVDANTTIYTDNNVETGRTYYYIVKAFDNQNPPNYSSSSNEAEAEIKDTTSPIETDSSYKWVTMSNGLPKGYIHSLAIDPTNTSIVYAGTDSGVFKTIDGGTNWKQINDKSRTLSVNCILIDPQNTNIVYAGIGKGGGGGVFKTTDGGVTWASYSNGLKSAVVSPPHPYVYTLAIDPTNTSFVYAGTDSGVFKTIDGGVTWVWLNGNHSEEGEYNPFPGPYIWSLAIDSHNSNIIYATVGSENRGVYKSIDGGQQWIWIRKSSVIGYFASYIIVDPNNSNIIYAAGGAENKGIFKSTDSGMNWNQIGLTNIKVYSLAIDPQDTSIVYAGTNEGVFKRLRKTSQVVITLQPDNPYMTVNGVSQEIDPGRGTKSVIVKEWGRTVVPIRAIVEALGGTISWESTTRKVTINFGNTTIELWIDKPQAKVNGETKWIDPNNHDVRPIIRNDRTMLPLRFVAESLGCEVDWDPDTRTITITYGG